MRKLLEIEFQKGLCATLLADMATHNSFEQEVDLESGTKLMIIELRPFVRGLREIKRRQIPDW
jgi:hypothetical protein